jgi:hypothetical protein
VVVARVVARLRKGCDDKCEDHGEETGL